jgi:hypothetical protein
MIRILHLSDSAHAEMDYNFAKNTLIKRAEKILHLQVDYQHTTNIVKIRNAYAFDLVMIDYGIVEQGKIGTITEAKIDIESLSYDYQDTKFAIVSSLPTSFIRQELSEIKRHNIMIGYSSVVSFFESIK